MEEQAKRYQREQGDTDYVPSVSCHGEMPFGVLRYLYDTEPDNYNLFQPEKHTDDEYAILSHVLIANLGFF